MTPRDSRRVNYSMWQFFIAPGACHWCSHASNSGDLTASPTPLSFSSCPCPVSLKAAAPPQASEQSYSVSADRLLHQIIIIFKDLGNSLLVFISYVWMLAHNYWKIYNFFFFFILCISKAMWYSSSDYLKAAIDSLQLQTNRNVIYLLGNHFNIREKSRPLETPSINYPPLFPPHPSLSFSLRFCPFPTEAIILQDVNTSSRAHTQKRPGDWDILIFFFPPLQAPPPLPFSFFRS